MDWRQEGPWLMLLLAALAAPPAVLAQGGDWHAAISAGLACLVAPCLGIEAMLALARIHAAQAPPPRMTGRDRRH